LVAGLFVMDKENRVLRFNRADLSPENMKQYSMDLHHIPFNRSLDCTDSNFFFSDEPYDRSCPKMLEYLPPYLEHKSPKLFKIMQPVLEVNEWEKTEHYQKTSADRFTGAFEITKMVLSLQNARKQIGGALFNSGIHNLKKEIVQFGSKDFLLRWGYIPTAAQLFLMNESLGHFPVV